MTRSKLLGRANRQSRHVHGLVMALVVCVGALATPMRSYGQSATMPEGWQELPPEEVIAELDALLARSPGPSSDHLSEVADHLYSVVTSEGYVSSADGTILMQLVDRLSGVLATWYTAPRKGVVAELLNGRLATDRSLLVVASFDEVVSTRWDPALRAGVARRHVADAAAKWMDEQDWEALSVDELPGLVRYLEDDLVDPSAYAVRWTGSLTPTVTGAHVFGRILRGGQMRVILNGQMILDSRDTLDPTREDDVDIAVNSRPVALTAAQPVSLVVEFVYERDQATQPAPRWIAYLFEDWAHGVLTWQPPGQASQEVVPSSVLTPPEGVGASGDSGDSGGGASGVQGDYYGDAAMTQLRQTQWDPRPALVAHGRAPTGMHVARQRELVQAAVDKLTDGAFLGGQDKAALFWTTLHLGDYLSIDQAHALLGAIAAHPECLTQSATHLRPWHRKETLGLVSTEERSIDDEGRPLEVSQNAIWWLHRAFLHTEALDPVVVAWCAQKPDVVTELVYFPGWASGEYNRLNHGGYWHLAQDDASDDRVEALLGVLTEGNGACNLRAARVLTFTYRERGELEAWKTRLDEEVANPDRTGDLKVGWLLARAYAQEVQPYGDPKITGSVIEWSNQAFAEATTEDVRLVALQELAARQAAVGSGEAALALLASVEDQFETQEASARFQAWRGAIEVIGQQRQARIAARAESARQGYLRELNRRLQRALARGQTERASQIQRLINKIEAP